MQIDNLTHPNQDPVDGDEMRYTHQNGTIEIKQYWSPVEPEPYVPPVPRVLTMRQARLVLFTAGLINAVQTAIDSLPSPDKEKAQIEWDYSNEVQRHNGFVAALGPALGLSEAQIDALFVTGATL